MVAPMKNMLTRNLGREIKRSKSRFLSIFLICLISVAFFVGMRSTGPDMRLSADLYFDDYRLADITVTGALTRAELRDLQQIAGVESVQGELLVDALLRYDEEDISMRLISLPFAETDVWEEKPAVIGLPSQQTEIDTDSWLNMPQITEGVWPQGDLECALDAVFAKQRKIEVGETLHFSTLSGQKDLLVTALVHSPEFMANSRGVSTVGNGMNQGFVYTAVQNIEDLSARLPLETNLATIYTRVLLRVEGADSYNSFSEEYENAVESVRTRVEQYFEQKDATALVEHRYDNLGVKNYKENVEKIENISVVFPMIFFLVAILVSLTTMTRMVEEERTQIGTLKALGYGKMAIVSGYILYAALAGLAGSAVGIVVGSNLLPSVIFSVYSILYTLPAFEQVIYPWLSLGATMFALCTVLAATILACRHELAAAPAQLMRPKSPRPGKRVLLEHTFIWKRLSFVQKVTVRNLFRYKRRFIMSIVGIAGSCALLVTGFGLQDSIFGIMDIQFDDIWKFDLQVYLAKSLNADETAALVQQTIEREGLYDILPTSLHSVTAEGDNGFSTSAYVQGVADRETLPEIAVLKDVKTGQVISLPDDGAVVTQKLARQLGADVGDTIRFVSKEKEYSVRVAAIVENYVLHYIYMDDIYYEKIFGQPMEYNCVFAKVDNYSEALEDEVSTEFLQDSRIISVQFTGSAFEDVMDSLNSINTVVFVLIVSAGALAFVVMYNLTNININERRRELATLKVLGFTRKETYSYVFRENNLLSIIGVILGLLGGIVLHRFVIQTAEVDLIMFVRQIKPLSFVYSAALTLGFSLIVNLIMRRKIRAVDMVESLKSVE